ncbi:VOC family protein [Paeniglutamicibacter sulfureus]|uniref:Catechol-2,3-dioxygenase n=1 Tax=Paeniglutamicibacter sulfureus TaxID=43666 RepID=A0ABU2BCY4_9MICC|nr:hypothetical protein [Paeniglutamicibacter sulfureus]MDR7356491.1 catechol-2,3-dioxygenase [Paeniglutamicibacter sulfureus]
MVRTRRPQTTTEIEAAQETARRGKCRQPINATFCRTNQTGFFWLEVTAQESSDFNGMPQYRFPTKGISQMKIRNVSITVSDLAMAVQFYRDTLLLPVEWTPAGADVVIGSSRLSMAAGDGFDGVHHLAFGILPSEFERAHEWLARRVSLFQADGSEIIPGPDDWNSRSLYFLGPEGIILEFIARAADTCTDSSKGDNPRILSISEVGLGVEDVLDAVATLSEELAIPNFYDCSSTFASMGGHDGLLIVVHRERVWFPTESSRPARGFLTVQIESRARKSRVDPAPGISIISG